MSSYKSIAKSSGLIAIVQIVQMFFGLFRNKAVSILLGSAAFGLYSIYNTLIEMGTVFAVFGLNNSIVRELARSGGDKKNIGKVLYTSNRIILLSSLIVLLLIIVFAEEIGVYLFNEEGHALGVRCVAFIVLFSASARKGYAVLNGIRSLRKLAVSQIVSSAVGSVGVVLAVWFWKTDAIPLALGIISVTMAIITFLYVRKVGIREEKVSRVEFANTAKILLYIGLGVTIASVVSTVMTIMSKSFLTEHYSLSAVGYYQSSWTISNLYTGIILTAMGVDFMPRLSREIDNNKNATELIDQQIIFGIVISSVVISGILLFSKEILYILYTKEFTVASSIVRWHIIGVFLRVIAYPFSYTILAKGDAKLYVIVQILFWTSDYVLLRVCSHFWGFDGLGINYPIAYIGYLAMTYFAAKKICKYSVSSEMISVLVKIVVFIAVAWGLSSLRIDNLLFRYSINGILLLCHFCFVNYYVKNKMKMNIWQFAKNKIISKRNENRK